MTKKEQVMTVLRRLGYEPRYDEDGDVKMRFEIKMVYFFVDENDEDKFVNVCMPQFMSIEEGKDMKYLAACNKMTRDTKLVKVFVDQTFQSVSATCDFYYTSQKGLTSNIEKVLRILSVTRTAYQKCLDELSD